MKLPSSLILTLSTYLLCSCGSEDDKQSSTEELHTTAKHAHDWTPTESALVNGKDIYIQECSGCHEEGEEGAPMLSRLTEWKKREAKGLEKLIQNAINGYQGEDGKMPARGGTPSLTDEEVTNAVKFMIATPKS